MKCQRPMLCVAPGSHNKIVLLKHNPQILQIIKEAIKIAWPLGNLNAETCKAKPLKRLIKLHGLYVIQAYLAMTVIF